ncbi:MAG: helix-turn-helix domain-containing protein [Candidatus Woesearchaeota archaeon]|nr:MAG: helix-turn-helix domain-containing protein [Candidatus Woesearchaeota archaeon]
MKNLKLKNSGWITWSQETFKKKRLSETLELTLKLFLQGKSLQEIGEARNFEQGTVEKHILDLITKSFIRASDVIGEEKLEKILSIITNKNLKSLMLIKAQLSEEENYFDIKCTLAHLSAMPEESRPKK